MYYRRYLKFSIIFVLFLVLVAALQFRSIMKYFYPMKYGNVIVKYSTEYSLDPCLVSAVINVESHYKPNAKSSKNAMGLMQITPSTGRWAAKNLKISNFNDDMLFSPETNIRIGCWYLSYLKDEYKSPDSDIKTVLAAYNGGSSNVNKWLKDGAFSQNSSNLDGIPFKETENYVKKVITDYKIYKWLYSGV